MIGQWRLEPPLRAEVSRQCDDPPGGGRRHGVKEVYLKNSTRVILSPRPVCAIVLATASIVHADLRDDVASGTQTLPLAPATRVASDINTQGRPLGSTDGLFAEGFSNPSQTPLATSATENIATSPLVRDLPAAPDSASLFLSAVLSVGAWHLVRSARQITGSFPAWYHSDGPQQIGAAVRFVPDEHVPALFIPIAIALAAPSVSRVRSQQRLRRNTWIALAIAVPRGPPPRALRSCL